MNSPKLRHACLVTLSVLIFSFALAPAPALASPLQPGDYNRNGVVDPADYTLWRDWLGASSGPGVSIADGELDGVVDQGDYEVWKANFTPQNILSPAFPASPRISVINLGANGAGNLVWSVQYTPDTGLFTIHPPNPSGASAAVEIGLDVAGTSLVSATKNAVDFPQENPGDTPFAFGGPPATGLSTSGNQLFAALGGDYFTTPGAREVLRFMTSGTAKTTVSYEALYAVQGVNFLTSGQVTSVPEPASLVLAFGGIALARLTRRLR
jgi:hypothetical protein